MGDDEKAPNGKTDANENTNDATNDDIQLSTRQMASLKGIINGLLPPLDPPQQENMDASVAEFWKYDLSSDKEYLQAAQETILTRLPPMDSWLLCILLYLLSTVLGSCLILTSLEPLLSRRSFSAMTPEQQTKALLRLKTSALTEKRKIFNGVKRLLCGLALSFVHQDTKKNPYWDAIGYVGPNDNGKSTQEDYKIRNFRTEKEVLIDVQEDKELTYDVVVVGSGAGGGVAAATLAAKGYSVLIVEKGPYTDPSQLTNYEAEALDTMYEGHGLQTTSDGNIMVLAGSTLGGGTTINWSCCLPLPKHVQEEWVKQHGLTQFEEGNEFDTAMGQVMKRIGCHDNKALLVKQHNRANRRLLQGCNKLKYKWELTGQNLKNIQDERAGYICFGDKTGNKQSGLNTFLVDAIDNGARVIENCFVEQVLQGYYKVPDAQQPRKRALGIVGRVSVGQDKQYKVTVKAKKCVIVAAGAIHTPCLLQRSWLGNKHIGRHLHVHPVIACSGFYNDSGKKIDCFRGAPMTSVCQEFADGYGAKIEVPSAHTGLLASSFQFVNPHHYKQHMLKLRHVAPLIILQRDTSEGTVTSSGQDGFRPRIDYTVNKKDKESMMNALKGAAKILIATGAQTIFTSHANDVGFQRPPDANLATESEIESNPNVQEYFAEIDRRGFRKHEMGVFVAHQMGSCRMGTSPQKGAVDENGETWEVDDLFVFDTSTFPTASGANPMMTVLAVSQMLSTRLLLRLMLQDDKLDGMVADDVKHAMDMLRLVRLRVSQNSQSAVKSILLFFLSSLVVAIIIAWFLWDSDVFGNDEL